jgi:multidrug efflux pump subunit AcrB
VFSRFFIDRPVFAAVMSIAITLVGGLSLFTLPLAQFPHVVPPTVQVQTTYPGASAEDVAQAVAAPIEQEVNGVEGMMYMSSQSTNDGLYNLTVTFHQGIDLDMAQVLVQNRVNLALPKLPDVIKATGVTTRKRSPDVLMGVALYSPFGRYDQLYLSNYALRFIKDELYRVPGVAEVYLYGQRDYSMRIWVDPDKLAARGLTAGDVARSLREENTQITAGMIGRQPMRSGQEIQVPLDGLGRLRTVEQFENVILRATRDGRILRLKDIARVDLGAKSEDTNSRIDGKPTCFLAVYQLPDANALETAERVLAKMDELKQAFPQGIDYMLSWDTTPYTRESIHEVFKTLRDAVILVALVVLLFLQNWRSAIIPLVAVPVAIIGTFAVLAAFGFSLNNLTLFGLVLAIGIVVDDAIVVVEAVEQHIEHGMLPRAATIKAMQQVSGPVVAVGLVLSAVFVPCAFIRGVTGMFFRQFALTIAASTIISAFNSLTLSPALTALLLRPRARADAGPAPLPRLAFPLAAALAAYLFLVPWLSQHAGTMLQPYLVLPDWLISAVGIAISVCVAWLLSTPINLFLRWFFRGFNRGVAGATRLYERAVGLLLRLSVRALAAYGALLALTHFMYVSTPRGFVPPQDMGTLYVTVQLPDAASLERTYEIMTELSELAVKVPGVKHATAVTGQAFALSASGSNFGSMFINLKEYKLRRDPELHADAIAARLRREFSKIIDGEIAVFGPPPIKGVGKTGGFAIMIEDRGDLGPHVLQEQVENLVRIGRQEPGLGKLFSVFRANVPQLQIEPDRAECVSKGVNLQDFADTLRIYQGSLYVNDFNMFGRTWQVIIQADAQFRDRLPRLNRLMVRNKTGAMVPLGAVAGTRSVNGPLVLARYNMYPAAAINGNVSPGVSSGQAIDIMERLANRELPAAMAFEWTEMSYLELLSGGKGMVLFGFAIVMVFLVLAAQYESWSLPLAVILVVPLCLLCALAGVKIANMDVNIFTQIGFVVLVGLASKNAILIVEFAKVQRENGMPRAQATLAACRLRLRPIVMTSLAFILGVVPLMIARGAGAEMRRALGVAVFSGMLGVTLFGVFLTPVFFFVIDYLGAASVCRRDVVCRARALSLATLTLGMRAALGRLLQRRTRATQASAAISYRRLPDPREQTPLPSELTRDLADLGLESRDAVRELAVADGKNERKT